ncbi:uncharacterized protein C8Q71DRAFT_855390 [Rhodofomes roseus]|uniref:Uncharacterized protein n=1 Tax=Rhodofomes roseus TaxID=34475 RepID=A0ABQ8KQ93_9APHY|nr:uncharacterized protein C8Q71DRAFT_855390 [Rhodofomes roseus]KAH9840096.1 hypothetical protein C8Q71DRAFT_855390 [Rhodofomes roseus]
MTVDLQDDGEIHYGLLVLTGAPKELSSQGASGAPGSSRWKRRPVWCALPSLLASTLALPPSLVVLTDYPDVLILANLTRNLERNVSRISRGCTVHSRGHERGQDPRPLLKA